MPDEQAEDERVGTVETAFKIDVPVVIRGLDVVLLQFKDRFSQENMEKLHEMKHFTPSSLTSSSVINAQEIEHICRFYSLDANTVARERNGFLSVYQSISSLIDTVTFARSLELVQLGHVGRKRTE